MRKEQRQQEILDFLRAAGVLSPKELAEQLYMSLSTVYRDIHDLEGQKLLIRTAEGQVAIPGEQRYTPAPYKRNIYIAKLLIAAKIPACFCGGKLLENSQVLGGRINQLILNSMPVDYMFFSPHAINEQGIIFDSVENSSRRNALSRARYSVCLCDHSKFGKTSIFHAASVRTIDYLITDAELPPNFAPPRVQTIFIQG